MIKCIALASVIAVSVAAGVWRIDGLLLRAPARPPTHPVAGKLYVNGVPAGNATIVFHPIGAHAAQIYRPVASSKADGSFSLMTYAVDDGAPAGEYVVTVVWIDPTKPYDECGELAPHDMLKGTYADPAVSPLTVTINAANNQVPLHAFSLSGWSSPRKRDLQKE